MHDEQHTCPTCGTVFTGNYCPRCGQSSRVGRYSFKKTFLLFLDVWGLGNRGMFHTLRDLLLRPGYMIRDYLGGMQMAYFPPFKMFFLLSAFSIFISSGFNINFENNYKKQHSEVSIEVSTDQEEAAEQNEANDQKEANADLQEQATVDSQITGNDSSQEQVAANKKEVTNTKGLEVAKKIINTIENYPTLTSLFALLFMSAFLYPFFRRCPAIPDMRFSELTVAVVYIANMYAIITLPIDFFCINIGLLNFSVLILTLVPLKQLSGFKWRKTILYSLIALVLMAITSMLLIMLGVLLFHYIF